MSFIRRLRLAPLLPSFMPNILGQPPSTDPQEYEGEPVAQDPQHHQEGHRVAYVELADAGEVRLDVEVHGSVDGTPSRGSVDDVEHPEGVYAPEDYDDGEEGPQKGHYQVPHPPQVGGPVQIGRASCRERV